MNVSTSQPPASSTKCPHSGLFILNRWEFFQKKTFGGIARFLKGDSCCCILLYSAVFYCILSRPRELLTVAVGFTPMASRGQVDGNNNGLGINGVGSAARWGHYRMIDCLNQNNSPSLDVHIYERSMDA